MGESAALNSENHQASHAAEDQDETTPQNELDEAIKELSGTEPVTDTPTINPASHPARSADTSAQIWDIPVDVNIVMGRAELTVARLMELENGDVVELNRRVGEPLDIAVNGQNIAKGKIVMNENDESQFAIQITELVGR